MRILYPLLILFLLFPSCKDRPQENVQRLIEGTTMGVIPYKIQVFSKSDAHLEEEIDQFFENINNELSTYVATSPVSLFNAGQKRISISANLLKVLQCSREIYDDTKGSFDPSVFPLIKYYGFYEKSEPLTSWDQKVVDSLKTFSGGDAFRSLLFAENENPEMVTSIPNLQLDFSAVAKGYFVDKAAEFLEGKGLESYFIDIGGEQRASAFKGKQGETWTTGIRKPSLTENAIYEAIALIGGSVATSGNYLQAYEVDGKKVVHTINPKTGLPELNQLLSVSVFMESCMEADAYATALMVMGPDSAQSFLSKRLDKMDAYLIYSDDKGEMKSVFTPGLLSNIIVND